MKNILIAICVCLLLVSCAHTIDVSECLPDSERASFWSGAWNGLTMTPAFVLSIFCDDITIYNVNNDGGWYNFGFIGGFFIIIRIVTSLFSK